MGAKNLDEGCGHNVSENDGRSGTKHPQNPRNLPKFDDLGVKIVNFVGRNKEKGAPSRNCKVMNLRPVHVARRHPKILTQKYQIMKLGFNKIRAAGKNRKTV